jgi:hypothetical protein
MKAPLFRFIFTLVLLFTFVFNSTAGGQAAGSLALVRLDLPAPVDLARAAGSGVTFYAHLNDPASGEYLLAIADPAQQAALAELGLPLRVLDADSRNAEYHIITPHTSGALALAAAQVPLLANDGQQAIARLDSAQRQQLSALGLELKPLAPITLRPTPTVPVLPAVITPDPIIQGIINQVNQTTVYNYDYGLSGEGPVTIGGSPYTILTRYSGTTTSLEKATQYVYEHFQSLGLATSYHNYTLPGYGTRRNVVAEQPGLTQPTCIYLITAHMDDTSGTPTTYAPGADDNASGTVGVLIAADILSNYNFACTLRYVLFTGEEQGLYGSAAYAAYVAALGEDIQGVLNLDMISYNSDTFPIIDLHTRSGTSGAGDLVIANLFVDVISAYSLGLTPNIFQDNIQYSDHASFWDEGYNAILGIEDDDDFTPYYHTVNDQIETLDMVYFTKFVKAGVATLAHLGGLLPSTGVLTGVVTDADSGSPIVGAQVLAMLSPNQIWQTTSQAGGAYHLHLLPGYYGVQAQAPGHMLYFTSGIHIVENITTTLNISLAVTPTLTITGVVSDFYSGGPVSATVSLLGSSYPPVQTDPDTGQFILSIFPGSYQVQVAGDTGFYYPHTEWVTFSASQSYTVTLNRLSLLVVDDDAGANYETYYTSALDRLGYDYHLVTSVPDVRTLAHFRGVIWLTGNTAVNTLTPSDQAAIAAYLDGGGHLFLSGQNLGEDLGATPFYANYLRAHLVTGSAGLYSLHGLDFLSSFTTIFLNGGSGANNQVAVDELIPLNGAQPLYYFMGAPSRYSGLVYDGLYHLVYFGFGYEGINQQNRRDEVMGAVMTELGLPAAPLAPAAAFTPGLQGGNALAFTNTSSGTPWMTYTWDFGDGSALATQAHPLHTFPAPGVYTVTLTVISPYGQDSFTLPVTVNYVVCLPLVVH